MSEPATRRISAPPRTGTDWLRVQSARVGPGTPLPSSVSPRAECLEVEAWLQGHGVSYAPPVLIPMQLIDERRSRANQARRDAIVTESVERFTAGWRSGAVFPPIVCFISVGRLVIIDGNNRQAAARKAGLEEILGIIIAEDTPSELITLLTVQANATHGVTPELSWRLQQAFHLCALGFDDAQAASAAAVTVSQMRSARQIAEADARAHALKIPGFVELPGTSRQLLGGLRDEPVFFQAVRTVITTGMTVEEVRRFVAEIKRCTSEGARIQYIGQVAKERGIEAATRRATGKALNRVSSPKTALVSSIGMLLKVDEAALARQVVTEHDRDLLMSRLRALEDKLLSLQVALEQAQMGEM